MTDDQQTFVPAGFTVPRTLVGDGFRLEPLGPEHNDRDLAARTGSIPHVRATPGFAGRGRTGRRRHPATLRPDDSESTVIGWPSLTGDAGGTVRS